MRVFLGLLAAGAGIAAGVLIWSQTTSNGCPAPPFGYGGLRFSCTASTQPGWAKAAAILAATLGVAIGGAIWIAYRSRAEQLNPQGHSSTTTHGSNLRTRGHESEATGTSGTPDHTPSERLDSPLDPPADEAIEVARHRYANGEISRDQFLQIREDLQPIEPNTGERP
jgi:hypothetical protein